MKTVKNITILAVTLILLAFLAMGCGQQQVTKPDEPIKIAALKGPTGMGMVYLMEEPDRYMVNLYQNPDEIVSKIITGEVDIAAVPSNLAAVLYEKTQGEVICLGVNTLGVLYLVENGTTLEHVEGLRGKKIYASGKGSAPEYILQYILNHYGINGDQDFDIQWMANHTDVMTALMSEEGAVALLPEPFVTVATMKKENVTVSIDLNHEWQEIEGKSLPMGVILAQKSFVENNPKMVEVFMVSYSDSVVKVNEHPQEGSELIFEFEILSDKKIAEKAIPKCNMVFLTGENGKEELKGFYDILNSFDPKSIGGKLPDENFYYEIK